MSIKVDPIFPENFNCTSHDERSDAEIAEWWEKPFAITQPDGTYEVRCLDGGCNQRSTHYGFAATVAEAEELGMRELAAFQYSVRSKRWICDNNGSLTVERHLIRPGGHWEREVLFRTESEEDLQEYLRVHRGAVRD